MLPSLVSALEFGGASAAIILPLVLQFGTNVSPEDYPNVIIAPLIKLYGSPDRGTRMALLEHLPEYADKLDQKAVSDKIYPQLVRPTAVILSLRVEKPRIYSANRFRGYGCCHPRSHREINHTSFAQGEFDDFGHEHQTYTSL